MRTVTAAPPGSFGHVASSRATIPSTLLSVTGEPAGAEPAIRAVINATDASRIIRALKTDDLRNQPIVARQHDAAAVQQWQQVAIKIGLRRLADLVADPLLAK